MHERGWITAVVRNRMEFLVAEFLFHRLQIPCSRRGIMAVQLSSEATSKTDSCEVEVSDADARLIGSIRQDIEDRTNGSIRGLEVSVHEGLVTISGRTSRYYKQLATSAVFDFTKLELQNSIVVY
jgi:hypothetical protein